MKYLRGHESGECICYSGLPHTLKSCSCSSFLEKDVQDLAWSSDNQYLASCAVDGHVIVWDGMTFGMLHYLFRL